METTVNVWWTLCQSFTMDIWRVCTFPFLLLFDFVSQWSLLISNSSASHLTACAWDNVLSIHRGRPLCSTVQESSVENCYLLFFIFCVGNMPSGLWQNEKLMWKNAENEDIVYPVALFSLDFENLTAKFRHSSARCTACCFFCNAFHLFVKIVHCVKTAKQIHNSKLLGKPHHCSIFDKIIMRNIDDGVPSLDAASSVSCF